MFEFIRAFSIIACIMSGFNGILLYIYRKTLRKVLFWYVALCFVFAAYCHLSLPHSAHEPSPVTNLYLVFSCFIAIVMNFFSSTMIHKNNTPAIVGYFNAFCILICAVATFIPKSLYLPALITIDIITFISYGIALACSYYMVKNVSKHYHFTAAGIICLIVSLLLSIILGITCGELFFSARLHTIPFFLILHYFTITLRYSDSRKRTQALSQSLCETIDKIKHSHNALMCTQMKSDFLYNTLDLIGDRCLTDPDTAEFLTVSLSKYLRHTLNFQQLKGIVPLENEIELIKAYVVIEKEKHPGISFSYKLPDSVPDIFIPPLSIQPLIENSIEHGIIPNGGVGKVTLTVIAYKDYYHIDVSDNGIGIPDDELAMLPDGYTKTARVGLYNIHTRLLALFNKGLVIQSESGIGTSISFVVPPDAQRRIQEMREKEND